ncbi:MAG TPA: ABC transporter substrate-binding protein [Acidimicrobiales bacterium]
MTKKRAWFRLLAVLFGIVLIAGACGGRDDDGDDVGAGDDTGDTADDEKKEVTSGPGFDGTTIKLGVLTPLSGPVAAPIGLPLTAGGDVYWERVNAAGGVAGKYKVEIVKEDNLYDTAQTKQKYTKIKDEVVMFSQILGTPPTQTVLQDLKADGLAASPASLDGEWVREPNLLPVGSTYQLQFVNAAEYLVKDAGFKGKPICIIAEEGAYGDAGIEGVAYAGKELDFDVAVTARFKAADQDLTAPLQQLKNGNCAAVFVTATPTPTAKILGTGAQLGFSPQWVGQSPSWVNALIASPVAPILEKSFLLAGEGPQWGDESVPGMKQLLDDIKKYKPDQQPDGYFVFGYAQAMAVHQVLETAVENGDLSREGILKAIEEAEVDSKGLYGEYEYGKASTRNPSRTTAIFKVNKAVPGNLEKVKDITSTAAKSFKFE